MKSKFISVILSVAVILGLMLVPAVTQTLASPSGPYFKVQPDMSKVGFSKDFSVNVTVIDDAADAMAGFSMYLLFDPNYVTLNGITYPALLPNGYAPDVAPPPPSNPDYNNTVGWAFLQYGPASGRPNIVTGFVFATLNFTSKSLAGTSYLNLTPGTKPHVTFIYDPNATSILDWSSVVNGTVKVGAPVLTVDVNPADKGDVKINNTITPSSYPNTTSWAWDAVVKLQAINSVPGWAFVNWTGDLTGSANPTNITMSEDKNVTANFAELPPELSYLGPANLKFTCRAGGLNPDDQILEIMNSGGYKLAWSVADDASWLSENPTNGNLTAGVHQNINVSVNNSLLDPATYYANVTISGSPGIVVPVTLIVTPATSIDVWRDLPGNAMALNQTYPGMKFDVYVNFTAPVNDFNSIGLTDVAPAGWGVAVLNTSCNPVADVVRVSGNKVEIAWFGPYNSTQPFSAMYTVTVPETATPGINLFPNCNIAKAWCEYYFGESEPLASCVKGEYEIMITVPGKVTGETRDVNAGLLPDTKVVLERGVIAGASDESSPNYTITCWNTSDDYWLRATKDRYFTLDTDVIGAIAGHNINHTQYIDWSTADLLVHGYNLDMEGDYGLVPTACSMAYAMKSVNLWLFWPAANKEWGLSDWKALESVNSWQSPT